MPEGPEVETVVRSLAPKLVGRRVLSAWVSGKAMRRTPTTVDLDPLLGLPITGLGRHGKLFWFTTPGEANLWFRLGMSGRLLVEPAAQARHKHCHVALRLDGEDELRYVDPRRFGEVWPCTRATLDAERRRLGADPIDWDDEGKLRAAQKLWRTSRSIKEALLDQLIFAGVGNIYASEACFYARLSPTRSGDSLDDLELSRLLECVQAVMVLAVENRGTSFSDFVDGEGYRGDNQGSLAVFGREGEECPGCGGPIARVVQGGRSTFYCGACQLTPLG